MEITGIVLGPYRITLDDGGALRVWSKSHEITSRMDAANSILLDTSILIPTSVTEIVKEAVVEGIKDGSLPAAPTSVTETPAAPAPVAAPVVAPVVPVAAPTSVTETELDINGLPWDERIHAKTKAKNANNTWRNRRGVDKALLKKVEDEIRVASEDLCGVPESMQRSPEETFGEAPNLGPAPAVAPVAAAPAVAPVAAAPVAVPGVPDAVGYPAAAAVAAPVAPASFGDLTTLLSDVIQKAVFTQVEIQAMNTAFGITNINEISGDPARIAQAIEYINTIKAQKGVAA